MKLYIVRHGESETNRKGLWTGWLDVALTDKGIADAERVRDTLRGIKFDKVYSSDLQRASNLRDRLAGIRIRDDAAFARDKPRRNRGEADRG